MLFNILVISLFIGNAQQIEKPQNLYQSKTHIVGNNTLKYRMLLPKDFSEDKSYPLVLVLHGSGERGDDNEKQLLHGGDLFLKEQLRNSFPAIVIFPQCPESDYWSKVVVDRTKKPFTFDFKYNEGPTNVMTLVIDLMEEMVYKPYVKSDQVYVMGLSMGGMGTFEILYRKPKMFAAGVPICGGGDVTSVTQYAKSVPLWVFHGAKDNVVNPKSSINMVSAILNNEGFPKFTLYDFAKHNSWDAAFSEPELLPWIFSKTK
ncbi:prolyl oligopeptidase family serine peptidase [Cellulophaga baltica]|nr:prolyl oligopeptidase family serine peptidase [Cellulophaga baltica]